MSKGHRASIKRQRNKLPKHGRAFQAIAKNVRIGPRKVRPSADLIRGQRVETAIDTLAFDSRRGSHLSRRCSRVRCQRHLVGNVDPMDPGFARAVDEAFTFKRFRARGRGRAGKIEKQQSHHRGRRRAGE